MALAPRTVRLLAAAALVMPGAVAARDRAAHNAALSSTHEPVVSRTDYSLDVAAGADGLAPGEPQRLARWFDALVLGYGDTVTVDEAGVWQGNGAADGVGRVLSRYGMLVSEAPPPVSVGHPPAGRLRVVVSRAVARVTDCPDWSRGNYAEYGGASTSNFGCAMAVNLAAMVANPQDLVEGQRSGPAGNADVTVKAIKSYRDAKNTGDAGLPGGVTAVSVAGTGK